LLYAACDSYRSLVAHGHVAQHVGEGLRGIRFEVASNVLVQVSRYRDTAVPTPS
jgi:hypothetical protein